jgi:hypothetical protein
MEQRSNESSRTHLSFLARILGFRITRSSLPLIFDLKGTFKWWFERLQKDLKDYQHDPYDLSMATRDYVATTADSLIVGQAILEDPRCCAIKVVFLKRTESSELEPMQEIVLIEK